MNTLCDETVLYKTDMFCRKFEMYKTIYQKNEQNSIGFNFIPKVRT